MDNSSSLFRAAYTASSHALDFVSLLLSKHNPKVVEASISPYIKEVVPLGSLGAEIMQEPSRSDAEKTTEGLVSLGWRLQSLNRSADSLLHSASRLEQEIDHETRYWQQILSVKEKGWSICRIPGESHTLAVRFGFAEGILVPIFWSRAPLLTAVQPMPNSATEDWQHSVETRLAILSLTAVLDGEEISV